MGWGESVILVRHNLSITPPAKHNFEHNTLVSQVMPEHNPTDPTVVLFSVFLDSQHFYVLSWGFYKQDTCIDALV